MLWPPSSLLLVGRSRSGAHGCLSLIRKERILSQRQKRLLIQGRLSKLDITGDGLNEFVEGIKLSLRPQKSPLRKRERRA